MALVVVAAKSAIAGAPEIEKCCGPNHAAFAVTRFRAMGFDAMIITDGVRCYTEAEIEHMQARNEPNSSLA